MDVTPHHVWAREAAARIGLSLAATDEEREQVDLLVGKIVASRDAHSLSELNSELRNIVDGVLAREAGRPLLSPAERQEIDENLSDLEDKLVKEILVRKDAQKRYISSFLILFFGCTLLILAVSSYVIFRGVTGAVQLTGCIAGFVAILSATIVVARLFQNSREALERLDEKIVAVRFLRMALHPTWAGETGGRLILPALSMFAQHFAPRSATLDATDTSALLQPFSGILGQK
jgi:hypothetical protein